MTTMITARVDSAKRKAAEKVFSEVGLTTSGAVNLFICAVAMTGGIPFPVTTAAVPARNLETPRLRVGKADNADKGGIKLGLANNRYKFKSDFDKAFDDMDAEVAELFG